MEQWWGLFRLYCRTHWGLTIITADSEWIHCCCATWGTSEGFRCLAQEWCSTTSLTDPGSNWPPFGHKTGALTMFELALKTNKCGFSVVITTLTPPQMVHKGLESENEQITKHLRNYNSWVHWVSISRISNQISGGSGHRHEQAMHENSMGFCTTGFILLFPWFPISTEYLTELFTDRHMNLWPPLQLSLPSLVYHLSDWKLMRLALPNSWQGSFSIQALIRF